MTKKALNSAWISALALATAAVPAFAQETVDLRKGAPGTLASLTISTIISTLIRTLVAIAAILFFFWLVLGGIKWITSGGDKAKTEEARQQITAALVGLVVVFSAWAIAQLMKTLFDVDIFNLKFEQVK